MELDDAALARVKELEQELERLREELRSLDDEDTKKKKGRGGNPPPPPWQRVEWCPTCKSEVLAIQHQNPRWSFIYVCPECGEHTRDTRNSIVAGPPDDLTFRDASPSLKGGDVK
jgi:hypothetical protein